MCALVLPSNARLHRDPPFTQTFFIGSVIVCTLMVPSKISQICPNGIVRFTSAASLDFPESFPGKFHRFPDGRRRRFRRSFILSPYWANVDVDQAFNRDSQTASGVFYHFYDQQRPKHPYELYIHLRATTDVRRFQSNPRVPKFVSSKVLVVTWQRMYNAPSSSQQASFDKVTLTSRWNNSPVKLLASTFLVLTNSGFGRPLGHGMI